MSSVRRKFFYVDAGYVKSAVQRCCRQIGLVPPTGFRWPLGEKFQGDRINIYDAPPPQKNGETDADYANRLTDFHDAMELLNASPNFVVRLGYIRGKGGKSRQKGVDVRMAVEMLNNAMLGRIEEVVLVSGDLDFKPVVDTLVTIGTRVTIFADRKTASKELISAADNFVPFELDDLLRFFPPSEYRKHAVKASDFGSVFFMSDEYRKNFNHTVLKTLTTAKSGKVLNVCRGTSKDGSRVIHSLWAPNENPFLTQVLWKHEELEYLIRCVAFEENDDSLHSQFSTGNEIQP